MVLRANNLDHREMRNELITVAPLNSQETNAAAIADYQINNSRINQIDPI